LTMLLNPFVAGRSGFSGFNSGPVGFAAEERPVLSQGATAFAPLGLDSFMIDRRMPTEPGRDSFHKRWSVWGSTYGGLNKTAGDSAGTGSHDTTARDYGLVTGFDFSPDPQSTVGFALAGGKTSWDLSDGLGGGSTDMFQAGAYGSQRFGPVYLAASFAYAYHRVSTDRSITIAGADHLTASFNAQNYGGRVEGGYRFGAPDGGVTPYAAAQVQTFRTPAYAESGLPGSPFALAFSARTTTATRTELGAWFDRIITVDGGDTLVLYTRAAWANDHSSDATINPTFQSLPGASFTVNGAPLVPNLALVSAGAQVRSPTGWSVGARFDGELSKRAQTYAGIGTVKLRW